MPDMNQNGWQQQGQPQQNFQQTAPQQTAPQQQGFALPLEGWYQQQTKSLPTSLQNIIRNGRHSVKASTGNTVWKVERVDQATGAVESWVFFARPGYQGTGYLETGRPFLIEVV